MVFDYFARRLREVRAQTTALNGGNGKVNAKLNNADAATAIGAFLRRLRRQGRNPDHWEAEQAIRAMAFLACDQYQQAIDHIGRALVPPSRRDPGAVTDIATSHLVVPSLLTFQVVLEEICDAGEGWATADEVVELVPEEKDAVYRLPAILRAARVRSH